MTQVQKELFISNFNNELSKEGFSKPVAFMDAFGFSTSKKRKQGGYNFVSIYKFYIKESELNSKNNIPINITASYGEELADGSVRFFPTSIKRKITWPIDLVSDDEFFYNLVEDKFYFKNGEISPNQIINKIEFLHTKPTKLFKGFILLVKLFFWRILITNLFKFLYYFFIKILYILSGIKTKTSIWLVVLKKDSLKDKEDIEKELFANEKINIFGYHASAWSVVVYATIHLCAYSFWYFCSCFNGDFLNKILSNGFLVITYVIPTLVLFERLIPRILEFFIKFFGKYFHRSSFRKIKI